MGKLVTIFKKELKDTLRDRRTIIAMVIIPLLLFPVIITIMTTVQKSLAEEEEAKKLRVAVFSEVEVNDFYDLIRQRDDIELRQDVPEDSIRSYIRRDSLDGAFVFSKTFKSRVENLKDGRVKFYFRSTEHNIKKERLKELIETYEEQLMSQRFIRLDLDEDIVDAVNLVEVDITTTKEKFGKAVGGFLPYIFVIFCFIGAMYPAIDLAAGEKERGTLETLLTAPVGRFQILLGKFGVVVLTGIGSALMAVLGLYIGISRIGDIPPDIMETIMGILEPGPILLLLSLLFPLTIFFAGILLTLSIFAKTFKEAQSMVTPVNIFVIVPVAIGLIPGIELSPVTALIPVLNVSLATKEIIAGTIQVGLLAEVYLSLFLLAGLSLFVASRIFLRETVIFRE